MPDPSGPSGTPPEQTEVIKHQMEETRSRLAEKVQQLSEQTGNTVQTVTDVVTTVKDTVSDTVNTVSDTVTQVKDTVAETVDTMRETVAETVDTVREQVAETVQDVKDLFNLSRQMQNHPWLIMGGAAALGFVGGRLLIPEPSGSSAQESESRAAAKPAQESWRYSWEQQHAGVAGTLMEALGPVIDKVKGMALQALFNVAKDVVVSAVPDNFRAQVNEIFSDLTCRLGAESCAGGQEHHEGNGAQRASSSTEESAAGDASQGGYDEKRDPAKVDRPLAAGRRKG